MRSRESIEAVIKAYDVRGVYGESLDAHLVKDIGAAFGYLVRTMGQEKIAIGYDMRPSSPELSRAFAEGAAEQGIDVVIVGLSSTDQLYFYSGHYNLAGAMFTASHNPAQYNGIKMCHAGAKPVGQESGLADITEMLLEGIPPYHGPLGAIDTEDCLEDYGNYLKGLVDLKDIRPLTVAVDAANGMAGLTVPEVFSSLPIDIKPLYFELDGTFPNHEANPLDPKNLEDLQAFTPKVGADIGLAFDGDADRCFVIDEKGQSVSPSAICALIAERYLERYPQATVIHNVITSRSVPEIIAENGGRAVRTRVGHSFIKKIMADEGAVFGGEHSAHYYFQEFFHADSGLLAALHVLAALGSTDQSLSEMMAKYHRYHASGEINTRLSSAAEQQQRTQAVLEAFAERIAAVDELDGVSVFLKDSPAWFNIRASNTEPLLRLNVEAPTAQEVDSLVTKILQIIRS
ncbi:phosphomannomutase/phosphoglucomutase [Corynebacterium sp. ES2794-CONJ1]|uniref:phosphomannomutase/phosphoglucomutase n=1 Tax=unclassified Corynebacterium TaxID=2624378 RepID=UPI0021672BA0|nr:MULTISPECIES: phosphomannomutase/phosphoglucomutase [unclassified Corynebacterium]MCS4489490.1 phosphomannomutase/phosphoglucomutase [Corynebacterium sp. ES2775-CONJ]MCS4491499.1 phosphomannomutase/phosphoglucomutase [Corynebacterium sp. ES2715-CONJ3]MCS4531401.1 phosphomannomutase/phosphoglucomutase [Corynebacterium sp. ES2730-CONJ]MCU9518788.1 phosphomannomutase/phosphoglucomutase [Corynebacterium sp. ES2794-CONJ1]